MLPARNRLSASEFPRNARIAYSSPLFTVRVRANALGRNRFAFVLGAKAEKKSTRRHFWKRRFYDMVKPWPAMGLDILLLGTVRLKEAEPEDVREELARARPAAAKFATHA